MIVTTFFVSLLRGSTACPGFVGNEVISYKAMRNMRLCHSVRNDGLQNN
jgi:hypothetical protein